jgi:hypothetical protein
MLAGKDQLYLLGCGQLAWKKTAELSFHKETLLVKEQLGEQNAFALLIVSYGQRGLPFPHSIRRRVICLLENTRGFLIVSPRV